MKFFQAVVETTPPSTARKPPSPADYYEDPVSPPPPAVTYSEFHQGSSTPTPLPDIFRHPTPLPQLHHSTPAPELAPVHLPHPTPFSHPTPVTPVHLPHPTSFSHPTPAPVHLPHPTPFSHPTPTPVHLPHPTPFSHPAPVTPVHLPHPTPFHEPHLIESVTPVPDIFNQIPGIDTDQLTEADLLLADPATHTHPLGTHPLLPIHPGYDIPHSHPPFNQHPVVDVASGSVLSSSDFPEQALVEVHQHIQEAHHAVTPLPGKISQVPVLTFIKTVKFK